MPGGDRTGPMGMGPMTGRAGGYCAGYPVPGYMNSIPGYGGFGFGRGLGRGRGWGRGFGRGRSFRGAAYPYAYENPYPAAPYGLSGPTPQQEVGSLQEEAKFMQAELNAINSRIKELESGKASESNE